MDNVQEIIPATAEQAVAPVSTAPMNVTNMWVDKDAFEPAPASSARSGFRTVKSSTEPKSP